MRGECDACGEIHELKQTPNFGQGVGALLCESCYHLNVTLHEGPQRWITSRWEDDLIQFARLLCEIRATQDDIDWETLCESMDLNIADVDDLFDRADRVWEKTKEEL